MVAPGVTRRGLGYSPVAAQENVVYLRVRHPRGPRPRSDRSAPSRKHQAEKRPPTVEVAGHHDGPSVGVEVDVAGQASIVQERAVAEVGTVKGNRDVALAVGVDQIGPNDCTTGLVPAQLTHRNRGDRFDLVPREETDAPLTDFATAASITLTLATRRERSMRSEVEASVPTE